MSFSYESICRLFVFVGLLSVSRNQAEAKPSSHAARGLIASTQNPLSNVPSPASVMPTYSASDPSGTVGGHSGCYAYFEKKDGCVSRSATNNCKPKSTTLPVQQVRGIFVFDVSFFNNKKPNQK